MRDCLQTAGKREVIEPQQPGNKRFFQRIKNDGGEQAGRCWGEQATIAQSQKRLRMRGRILHSLQAFVVVLYPNCSMEEEGRLLPEEVTGAAYTHRAEAHGSDLFQALIQKFEIQGHKKLSLPEAHQVYHMLVDLGSETAGNIPPELYATIRNVSMGFGFLTFDQLPCGQKVAFIQRIRREQRYRQRDRLSLTPEQAAILQRVASAIGIEYDPGQPEDETKRTFSFSGIESHVPDGYHLTEP